MSGNHKENGDFYSAMLLHPWRLASIIHGHTVCQCSVTMAMIQVGTQQTGV